MFGPSFVMQSLVAFQVLQLYLKPKVTLHCYYICLFWALVSGILNEFNSY